ncbi:MAG: DUF1289 domain-containing protein [Pseudomonadota bacterium]
MRIDSPCVKICALDAANDVCSGCGRTIDEIRIWGQASAAQREAILALLPARIAALKLSIFTG